MLQGYWSVLFFQGFIFLFNCTVLLNDQCVGFGGGVYWQNMAQMGYGME